MHSMEDMQLTMEEKQGLIEQIKDLVMHDIINRDDRRDIYCVCLVACDREMAKMKKE